MCIKVSWFLSVSERKWNWCISY